MKQILFTAVGTWMTIAAAMGLTYFPGDVSPHDKHQDAPIIRKLNVVSPGERGAGIRIELSGLFPNESILAPEQHHGVMIRKWWVEALPRDYRRVSKPLHENVGVYLSIMNSGDRTLKVLEMTIQFVNGSGYILYEENTETLLNLPAGQSAEKMRIWYAENNEFVSNGPYDIVSALLASGSLQLKAKIRKATFIEIGD